MRQLTLYTRKGCHLCDDMKALLDRVQSELPFELSVVDIDSDPALREQYDWEVPVLMVNGKKAAKYRIEESALRRRLEAE
jgi:glutaredoxin